jgi:TolA-binding protein
VARDRGVLAARARLEIGRLHFEAGDKDAALSEFLKVAVLYAHAEEVAEGLFLAAKCLESQGDPSRARAQYQEIVEKHPKSSFAEAARARLRELSSSQ